MLSKTELLPKVKYLHAALTIKAVSGHSFEGYASVFGNIDSDREAIAKGAFAHSLEDHSKAGRKVPILWQHDHYEPIGVWEELVEDEHGLYGKGVLTKGVRKADEAHLLMKAGALTGISIGFVPITYEIDEEEGLVTYTDVDLWEASPVTFPANSEARVTDVKARLQAGDLTKTEFERFLRDAGMGRKQAQAVIACGWAGLMPRDAADQQSEEQLTKSLDDLINRIKGNSNV